MIDTVEKLLDNGVVLDYKQEILNCSTSIKGVVVIPDSIKGFAYPGLGFGDCNQLTHIYLPTSFKRITSGIFNGCSNLIQIDIPDSIEYIDCAFINCNSLRSIRIPQKTIIQIPAFQGLNLHIEVDENNPYYVSINGSLYNKDRSALIKYYSNKIVDNVVIEEGVEKIKDYAFSGCTTIKTIYLPDSVKEIGIGAFSQCVNLEEIRLPEGISDINKNSFENCENLSRIIIPESVKQISDEAFKGCKSLFRIDIKGSKVNIKENAFGGCCSLKKYCGDIETESFLFTHLADSDSIQITSSEKTINAENVFQKYAAQFKVMSMLYHSFGMNITKIRGSALDYKSFKALDKNWPYDLGSFFDIAQSNEFILSEDWYRNSGIGLVLGWNKYRAIDVDNINDDYIVKDPGFRGLIDEFLFYLGLPKDYPWVVKSGSGHGFHIIFKCDYLESEFSTKSYSPNFNYFLNDFTRVFGSLELRWRDHLILPPSIHHSGNHYEFYGNEENDNLNPRDNANDDKNNSQMQLYQKVPSQVPMEISIANIDNLILHFCGRVRVKLYKFKDRDFRLAELCKCYSEYESWSCDVSTIKYDTLEWLEKCNSSAAFNSIAIKHILGDEVAFNKQKAFDYFTKSNSDLSHFNLASLIACGFFEGTYKDVEDHLSMISDDEQFSYLSDYAVNTSEKLFNEILSNAEKTFADCEYYLFFDTETTGIPNNYKAPSSDIDNWPRLVQLAWILTDQNSNRISKSNYIIKPEGFTIPAEASNVHGITTQIATEKGILIKEVLDLFLNDFNLASCVVGHNIEFDKKIIGAELVRLGMNDPLETKTSFCTMQSSIELCKIPSYKNYGYKYPKLQELYKELFGIEFDNAHNAMSDIEATEKCFWELRERGFL